MDGVWSPSEIPVCLPGSENYDSGDNFDDDYEDDSEDDYTDDVSDDVGGDDGDGYCDGHDALTLMYQVPSHNKMAREPA